MKIPPLILPPDSMVIQLSSTERGRENESFEAKKSVISSNFIYDFPIFSIIKFKGKKINSKNTVFPIQ